MEYHEQIQGIKSRAYRQETHPAGLAQGRWEGVVMGGGGDKSEEAGKNDDGGLPMGPAKGSTH